MRARKYNKQVEIWQTLKEPDGFGGNTINEQQITTTWARVETFGSNSTFDIRSVGQGVTDTANSIKLTLRKRNDITYSSLNQFIVYRGDKYIIQKAPTNLGFLDAEIEIIATRQSIKGVNEIAPIGNIAFDYTFNYIMQTRESQATIFVNNAIDYLETKNGTLTSTQCAIDYLKEYI